MVVILEFSVPPESFMLGEILSDEPEVRVDVEQVVPIGDNVMPFSWVTGDPEGFESGLKAVDISYEVVVEDEQRGRKLYRLEWRADDDDFVEAVLESEGTVLDATGTSQEWVFRVRFRSRESLSRFHRLADDAGLGLEVNRIYNPIEVSGDSRAGMTLTQTQTLTKALEMGYFNIPRETSLVELAEEFGVSDQAVSERLRRANVKLIESALVKDEEEDPIPVVSSY